MIQCGQKGRNYRVSTKASIEDEIVHLRGLDLKGLRARWQSVLQRPRPIICHGISCLRSSLIGSKPIVSGISTMRHGSCWIDRFQRKPAPQCRRGYSN